MVCYKIDRLCLRSFTRFGVYNARTKFTNIVLYTFICHVPTMSYHIQTITLTYTGPTGRAGAPAAAGPRFGKRHHVAMLLHQLQQAS